MHIYAKRHSVIDCMLKNFCYFALVGCKIFQSACLCLPVCISNLSHISKHSTKFSIHVHSSCGFAFLHSTHWTRHSYVNSKPEIVMWIPNLNPKSNFLKLKIWFRARASVLQSLAAASTSSYKFATYSLGGAMLLDLVILCNGSIFYIGVKSPIMITFFCLLFISSVL